MILKEQFKYIKKLSEVKGNGSFWYTWQHIIWIEKHENGGFG